MTTTAKTKQPTFARESSRIGLNLVSLVIARMLCLVLSLFQIGITFRALTLEGVGQYGFALNYPALFVVFATLGIQRLLVRDIARDPSIAWTHVWTATLTLGVLSTLVTILIMASMHFVEPNPLTRWAVFMASLSIIVLYAIQRPFEALITARERMVSLAVLYLIGGIARLACTYWALKFAATSASAHAGIAIGNLAAFLLTVLVTIRIAGWERPRIRWTLARDQIVQTNAFTIAMVFSQVYFKSDMSILKWLQGENATAIYTAAQRVTEPLFMIAGIWGTAVFPALCRFSVNAPGHYNRLVRTNTRLAMLVAFPMAFGIAFLAEPIVLLLTGAKGGEFNEAITVLRILSIVTPFFYFNGIGQEYLYARHHNWSVVWAYGLASAISICGNLLLIPWLGPVGAAWVAVAANAAISIWFLIQMQHDYGPMHLFALTLKTTAACIPMGFLAHTLYHINLILGVVVAGILYLVLQYLFRTLDPEEQHLVTEMTTAPFKKEKACS